MADHTAIVEDIRTALAAGDKPAARKLARRYANGADPELAQDLIDRAHAVLRTTAENHADRLIDERRARYRAQIADERRPVAITRGQRQPARTQRSAHAQRKTQQYFDNRGDNPRENRRDDAMPYGSGGLDDARQASISLRGQGCLACNVERTPTDRQRKDGLCGECRDSGLTRDDAVNAHCARIAARARKANASPRDALLAVWRNANQADQARIVLWVETNRQEIATRID